MIKVTIPGGLMDLNKFINYQRGNKYNGAKHKKQQTYICAKAFQDYRDKELELPITLKITWYCKDKRKDKDNICFSKKFILDGMIESGIIKNDGWSEIAGFIDKFEIDKDNPRIEIEILENITRQDIL